jgi:hypothetical protein
MTTETKRVFTLGFIGGVIGSLLMSLVLCITGQGTNPQAYTKSETPKAAQSVTEPSLKVASQVNNVALKKKPESKPLRAVKKKATRSASREYRGKYYNPRWESVRKCIVQRESGGNYQAKNKWSTAAGAYQFILGTSNAVARMMGRGDLVGTSARYWSKFDQDRAFWTLFNHGRGKYHWNYPPKQCW